MYAKVESLAHAIAGKGADNIRINQASPDISHK
jgi:hypothetical protein